MKLSLSFSQRVILLVLLLMLGLILSGGLQLVLERVSDNTVAIARISVICQGFLAFILPAVVLALLVTRLPAEFLMIKQLPRMKPLGLAVTTLLLSMPGIEWINALSAQLPWPEQVMAFEAQAEALTIKILGVHDVPNLIVSILVVGVFTGLAEELFFRGALQRVLQTRPLSIHAAVWISAIIFSLMHGQAVGFAARTLLGAMFGYAAIWSGSLWTAIVLHALNNTCAIVGLWFGFSLPSNPLTGIISIVLACAAMRLLKSSAACIKVR